MLAPQTTLCYSANNHCTFANTQSFGQSFIISKVFTIIICAWNFHQLLERLWPYFGVHLNSLRFALLEKSTVFPCTAFFGWPVSKWSLQRNCALRNSCSRLNDIRIRIHRIMDDVITLLIIKKSTQKVWNILETIISGLIF